MTAALFLTAYVALASTAGATALRRARWAQAAPRWGVGAWQALTGSIVLAGLLAAPALALCMLPLRVPVADLVGLTPLEVARHYEPAGGDWIGVAALVGAALVVSVVAGRTVGNVRRATRVRREQLATLALVGHPHPDGYTVLDHASPVVYCLPGRGRTVVVSRGALDLLSPSELRLVLGHERTHLRARHDIALAFSDALARTFSWVPVFRLSHRQISMLVEMQADDTARAGQDRRSLAHALITLSAGRRPDAALAAASNDAVARVRRLTSPDVAVPRLHKLGIACGVLAVLVLPLGLALAPALEASSVGCCEVAGLEPHP